MAKRKATDSPETPTSLPPALTLEGRENQLIAATYDLVEKRILDGSASSQETTYFLKAGSSKMRLELEHLREENKLLRAKTETLQAQRSNEELLSKAMQALRGYRGEDEGEDDEYQDVF